MKSAEEWLKTMFDSPETTTHTFKQHIEAIQLDAMKEGMRRAAAKLERAKEDAYKGTLSMNEYGHGVKKGMSESVSMILSAAEQLTDKEL